MLVEPCDFREAMQRLGASVTVITTACEGRMHGMTATAVCSVSTDPPSLLICINRGAGLHGPVQCSRRFCVNILAPEQMDLAARFASSDATVRESRFQDLLVEVLATGAPAIRGSLAAFDCQVVTAMDCKTHTIFIGLVERVRLEAESRSPLVYLARRYGVIVPLPEAAAPAPLNAASAGRP